MMDRIQYAPSPGSIADHAATMATPAVNAIAVTRAGHPAALGLRPRLTTRAAGSTGRPTG